MSIYVDIEKKLGDFRLKISFSGGDEVIALLGASGCGKSLTLKCIAGIERPDRGRIEVDGQTLFDSDRGVDLAPQKRRAGLLFQNYALFPNMTVLQNLRAGARRERDPRRGRDAVARALESFGLEPLAGHYPHQLSGGQRQRAALARILVSGPNILLLDEPFSALDSHLRFRMEQELRERINRFGRTVIFVSHDRDEVFRLADKIAVMDGGRLEVFGEKREIFSNPRTRAAAVLTGCKNIAPFERMGDGRVRVPLWGVELEAPPSGPETGFAGIRMHDIRPGEGPNSFSCRVIAELENPFSYTVTLSPEGAGEDTVPLGWELDKERWRSLRGELVTVCLPPDKILLLRDLQRENER